MEGAFLDSPVLAQLHGGQKNLISLISDLAKYGMDINLPRAVVIGDQSSRKSSALEAITGIRFPINDGTDTRFPVELRLRPDPRNQNITVCVKIESSNGTLQEEYPVEESFLVENGFPGVVDAAKKKILQHGAYFSEDTLIIDIRGPSVPFLSLVDLPGLCTSQDDDHSIVDREIVDRLMERHMSKCLILAVISTQHIENGVISQQMLSEIRRYDKDNTRTLGIISGVKSEEDTPAHTPFWGWHMLRDQTGTEISEAGKASLRGKLNSILLDYARRDTQRLSIERKDAIIECKSRLRLLGEPRSTSSKLRAYLDDFTSQFNTLCLSAIEGSYDDEFFGGLSPEDGTGWFKANKIRKLQLFMHNQNRAFVHVMNTKGSKHIVIPKGSSDSPPKTTLSNFMAFVSSALTPVLNLKGSDATPSKTTLPDLSQELVDQYDFADPVNITFEDVAANVRLSMLAGRDPDNTMIINFFRDQSQPWEAIARRHLQLTLTATEEFVKKLIYHIAGPDVINCSMIISKMVKPFFDQRSTALEEKLQELLYYYKSSYLHVLDTQFQAPRSVGHQENGVTGHSEGPNVSGIEDLIDKLETCYKISLRTFTDNVITFAVEGCLIKSLPCIITADKFKQMSDEELEQFVSQAHQQQEAELDLLKKGLDACIVWGMKPMPSMQGDLFKNRFTTTVDELAAPIVPVIQDLGVSNASTQTEQRASSFVMPESSTKTTTLKLSAIPSFPMPTLAGLCT